MDRYAVISEADASRDFYQVIGMVEKNGQAVILKDGQPRYMLIDLENMPLIEMTEDEKIDFVASRILKKHRAAFLELAR